jgi:amino acid transporter
MSTDSRPETSAQPALLRAIGTVGATSVVIGSVIGSGIFFKANVVAQSVGRFDLVIVAWVVCGAISLLGALSLAELAAMMPHAGGPYVYLREAYGPLVAFLWGWAEFWTIRSGSIAALAVAFSHAFLQTLGSSTGAVTSDSSWTLKLTAISAIGLLTAVNYAGVRWGGLTQNVTTFLKVAALLALVALPFVTGTASPSKLQSTVERPPGLGWLAGFAAAMTAIFWAYDGWGNIGAVAEEIHHPQRSIPLALAAGMFIVIALYLVATLAYHLVLPLSEIAASSFVAATAAQAMLGPRGAMLASAAVMVSTFGALNANLLVGPRVLLAMGRDRAFLPSMSAVHPRFRTPHRAILAVGGWAVVLILASDLLKHIPAPESHGETSILASQLADTLARARTKAIYDMLTDYVIFGAFVFYQLAVAAVLVLRQRRPDWPRPYRTWGYPILPLVFVVTSLGFLAGTFLSSPIESLLGLGFIACGAAFYGLRRIYCPPPTGIGQL